MDVDFGRTAADYARHRAGFPQELIEKLQQRGIGAARQAVIDVGTGTGSLARLFATAGCRVLGLDRAEALITQAVALDRTNSARIKYMIATAEAVAVRGSSIDVYAAGQCWHWFDRAAAAAEARRVLRPGGALVICHFDWLPLANNVVASTERLIRHHNPDWKMAGGTGIYPQWTMDVAEAGFEQIETFSFDVHVPYSHEAWRGRIRASAGIGGSLTPIAVQRFDRELQSLLAEEFEDPLDVPHRVWALAAQCPSPQDG